MKPLRTVLFVEDEDSLRTAITKLLRKRDYTVTEAHDGRSALESFQSDPARFDIVLLDVTLPGMPGPEIYDELRRIRPDVKVILCTAYSEETAMAQFGEREICGFLRKPYRIDDLVNVICTVAAARVSVAHQEDERPHVFLRVSNPSTAAESCRPSAPSRLRRTAGSGSPAPSGPGG